MHKHRVRVGNWRARKPEERELQLAAALHSRTRQTKPGQRQIKFEFHRVRLLRSQQAGRRVTGLHPEPGHKFVIDFLTASLQPFARKATRGSCNVSAQPRVFQLKPMAGAAPVRSYQ